MIRSIAFVSSAILGLVTASAQTWTRQNVPTSETVTSIFFISANEGWAAGYGPILYHTTNGGATWLQQGPGVPKPIVLSSVRFVDPLNGWAGAGDRVVRTTNGGALWQDNTGLYLFASPYRNTLYPTSASVAWAPAQDGTFMWFYRYTVNGPRSVLEETFNPVVSWTSLVHMSFADENTGWAVGRFAEIWKITNATSVSPSFTSLTKTTGIASWLTLWGVSFVDQAHGWVVGDSGTIIKTTDGGSSWIRLPSGTKSNLRDVCFADTDRGIAVGDQGTILGTVDGGSTWTPQVSGVTTRLAAVHYVSGSLWFAAGGDWGTSANGVILRSGIASFVESGQGSEIPSRLALHQNYPNPFNPATAISYQLSAISFVTLKVCNILGTEVANLVNDVRSPGTYTLQWDASSFPSGTYFYRLQAGKFVETKKMILLR